jgi:hypothetical protein
VQIVKLPRLYSREDARRELVGTQVPEMPATITSKTLLVDADTDEPIALYAPLGDCSQLRACVRHPSHNYGAGVYRAALGYRSKTFTFGTSPRKPTMQRESCMQTPLARDRPELHAVLSHWGSRLQAELAHVLPDAVAESQAVAAEILPEWRLNESTLWTSGVVNDTVAMPYHTDTGNFDVWSAMPVMRRGVRGGFLHLAEYGAVLECRDSWGSFFPGHRLVHGVTPIRKVAADGYRLSVVYYALRGMKDCATIALETARAREKRTEREHAMAAELKGRLA